MNHHPEKAWADLVERARRDAPGERNPGALLKRLGQLPVPVTQQGAGLLESFAALFGTRASFATCALIILGCGTYSLYEGLVTYAPLLPWLEFFGKILGGAA